MMIIFLLSLLSIGSTADENGWLSIERDAYYNYHLETTPLEIRTNSELESNDRVTVFFSTLEGHYAGGINLSFGSSVKFWIWDCSTASIDLPVNISSSDTEKVWRITLVKTSSIRLVLHCNNVEVLDFLFSDATCGDRSWSKDWSREVAEIEFEVYDTASDFYRPQPDACAAGTYRSSNKSTCNQCEGESISYEGAASCTPCAVGESANSEKTECGAPASNSDSTENKDALLIPWILAGFFFLTTVLITLFAARNLLRRICSCRNTADTEDADKQIKLISAESSPNHSVSYNDV